MDMYAIYVSYFYRLDTAGQEEYTALLEMSIRSSEGIILTIDPTNEKCIEKTKLFLKLITQARNDVASFPFVFAVTKSDLPSKVSQEQLQTALFCNFPSVPVFHTSIYKQDTVAKVFETLAYQIMLTQSMTWNPVPEAIVDEKRISILYYGPKVTTALLIRTFAGKDIVCVTLGHFTFVY